MMMMMMISLSQAASYSSSCFLVLMCRLMLKASLWSAWEAELCSIYISPQVPVLYNNVLAHGIGISRLHACIREQQTVLLACSFQSRPYPPNLELAASYLSSYSSWVSSWLTRFRRRCTTISVSWWFDGGSPDLLVPADGGGANSNP
jgi:hypothetical protein